MRKLFLATAILASGVSTYATSNNLFPIEVTCSIVNDDFKEVSIKKVPAVVAKTIKEYFPKATISKAFINSKEQYKFELLSGNKPTIVYTNKEGNLLDEKELKNKK
ncbi:hypothetical protein PG911_02930 [Tenacibaculum ovolyticum]|uniref:hypothetical protein n=1 Tax=Tenacibaculum ovolyticum TaxID=104270 RepID=UPI0022F3878F|nr:hypothetical protein [Tenacibaculum ovolyticum]WBX77232.1 hypothetical protein PG911_02930 [Tenacibaculum ovolyticum]